MSILDFNLGKKILAHKTEREDQYLSYFVKYEDDNGRVNFARKIIEYFSKVSGQIKEEGDWYDSSSEEYDASFGAEITHD